MYHMKTLNIALKMPLLEILSWHTYYFWRDCCICTIFDIFQRIFWLALIISLGFPNTLHQKSYFFCPYIILHSLIIFETKIKQCAICETFYNFCSFLCTLTTLYSNFNTAILSFYFICFQGCTFPSNLWDCRLLESRDYALSTSRTLL